MILGEFINKLQQTIASVTNITGGVLGIVYVGTWADLLTDKPAASNLGKFAIVTDKPVANSYAIFRSNGTCWDRLGGGPIVHDTFANCNAYNMATYDGCTFRCTDIGAGGYDFVATGGYLRPKNTTSTAIQIWGADFTQFATYAYLLVAGNGGTYAQAGTTITVTLTAHGISSDLNGSNCHLTIGTGLALTGWFTNFAYVDANTFTVTSSVSQSTSGNLAANISNTRIPWTYTFQSGLIKKKDSIALAGYNRAKATAGTKTIRYNYSGVQRAASSITNSDVFTASGPPSQIFVGGDNLFLTTGGATLVTDTDRTYSVDLQCSTNTDWVWFFPNAISWGPRYGL